MWACEDFPHLYMLPEDHPESPLMLDFFITPPDTQPAWLNVQNEGIQIEDILQYHTLLGGCSRNDFHPSFFLQFLYELKNDFDIIQMFQENY